MSHPSQLALSDAVAIGIGGMAIALHTQDFGFRQLLEDRYAGFIEAGSHPQFDFDIDLFDPSDQLEPVETKHADDDVQVSLQGGQWLFQRGDFHARWDATAGRGHIRQSRNPYAVDSVLRIVHTLILARQGGFLVHAASAIHHGHAFLFAGVSGAGKTTISRLAPADTLLADRRNFLRATSRERVRGLGHAVRWRVGKGRRKPGRAFEHAFLAGERSRKSDRGDRGSGRSPIAVAKHSIFCRGSGTGEFGLPLRMRVCREGTCTAIDICSR